MIGLYSEKCKEVGVITMHDIEFRGKRTDNGEWVYGNLVRGCDEQYAYIVELGNKELCRNYVDVDPETIGQYTGLADKNGTKIFEGDMISTDLERPYNIVEYRNGCFMLNCYDGNPYYDIMFSTSDELHAKCDYAEVIGNIYDSPELLGGNNNG